MLKKLVFKQRQKGPSAVSTLERLYETLEMLEKKEHVLQKKINAEVEKAKDYTKLKNKKAAIQCLKKKKLYEAQIEQIGNFQLRVHDQMILVEGAKSTIDTIDAMKTGSAVAKSLQKKLSVDEIDKAMQQVDEQSENMKQIQEALAAPVGSAADFDEDELEAELEDLEEDELKHELLQPPPSVIPVPVSDHSKRRNQQTSIDVDELSVQAEMAM
ncbi:Vacuolar protein sorting-associated protein 32 like 1 [Apostasia shenzhenica]|uniref:Vacuolar protein sorting-associated protein 32 like 1 n=1 Tax=Apostasia shenzhenica TaxID=1088818 RepID=A0A2I0A6L2_9ASPA|nr:Vacuolar protein sorting-associated protein 32 like 1 [Apostasia shenzhenica]